MTSSPEIPIGERLRFYRQAQHKSQAVIAGLAGVTEDYLSKVERGLKTPTISTLHRLGPVSKSVVGAGRDLGPGVCR